MRIGIDGTVFVDKQFTGVTRSVYEIVSRWVVKHPDHEYFIICRVPMNIKMDLPDNWHEVVTLKSGKAFFDLRRYGKVWNIIKLPQVIKELDLDVYWGTNYILPLYTNRKVKCYVTIYDLALFIFDGIGEKSNQLKLNLFAKRACKKANKVITISEATAKDVNSIFGIEPSKIVVSYCGSPENRTNYDLNNVKKELVFDEDYFLFISTIEPRKNIITIIKAFEEYIDKTGNNKRLVIAGKKGWNCDNIFEAIANSKHRDKIILPGYISTDDKAYLLSHAEAFLYPSLYEGFGLPILEAFRYDLPVITANNSSLPEVGGEAAFYINDVYDYKSLADQMIKIDYLNVEERNKINRLMQRQLEKFSWEKNSDEMMDIITDKL